MTSLKTVLDTIIEIQESNMWDLFLKQPHLYSKLSAFDILDSRRVSAFRLLLKLTDRVEYII